MNIGIKIDRTKEKRMMNCGMEAEIIRYGNSHDIDLRFTDGTILCHKSYKNFKSGSIKNPKIQYTDYRIRNGKNSKKYYEHATFADIKGKKYTIVKYLNYHHVEIESIDGIILEVSVDDINNKLRKLYGVQSTPPSQQALERIGMTKKMNCGLTATIIAYRSSSDIDVRLSDGTVITGRYYSDFKRGCIALPQKPFDYSREDYIMSNGQRARIHEYRNSHDIDVIFEDGTIVYHKGYQQLKKGHIKNPNAPANHKGGIKGSDILFKHSPAKPVVLKERIGQTLVMNNGMEATIIEYEACNNITIRFSNGTIVNGKRYWDFRRGRIGCPGYTAHRTNNYSEPKLHSGHNHVNWKYGEKVGISNRMNCGEEATIIAYRNNVDMDIQFSDGTVRKNIRFDNFMKGTVSKYPDEKRGKKYGSKRVGETNTMNCGMAARIIAYRSSEDLDVQFSDGYIKEHVRYQTFAQGRVYNPNTYGTLYISRNEFFMQHYLEKYGFEKAPCGALKDMGLGNMELDLYAKDLNGRSVAIEYDGGMLYKGTGHTPQRDIKKDKLCLKAGIDLIRIREPQLPLLASTSHCFQLKSSELLSENFKDVFNQVIAFLNSVYGAHIPVIGSIDKDLILKKYADMHGGTKSGYRTQHSATSNLRDVRVSEVRTMNCGMDAMIIAYRNQNDMDIEFEDGVTRHHVRYQTFLKGQIAHKAS